VKEKGTVSSNCGASFQTDSKLKLCEDEEGNIGMKQIKEDSEGEQDPKRGEALGRKSLDRDHMSQLHLIMRQFNRK